MRRLVLLGVAGLLSAGGLSALPPADADGCGVTATIAGTVYVDYRGSVPPAAPSVPPASPIENVWVYVESNGEPGLQAGGASEVFGHSDAQCPNDTPDVEPDTLVL